MTHGPAHIPPFGNWDANDQVPFSVVFDNVHAGKGGGGSKMLNPNNPVENQGSDTAAGLPARRQSGDGQGSSRAGLMGKHRRGSGGGGSQESAGVEESPNHQMYEGRLGNRTGSPYWERKNPAEGGNAFAPGTPGKSRLRPGSTRADETPDRGTALPPFGAWKKDPSAGDRFTEIFNQACNEKKTGGPVQIPALPGDSPAKPHRGDGYGYKHVQDPHKKKSNFWSCCLGCLGSSSTD